VVVEGGGADAGGDGEGFELAGVDLAVGVDVEGVVHGRGGLLWTE